MNIKKGLITVTLSLMISVACLSLVMAEELITIRGVTFGMSTSEVEALWGEPVKIDAFDNIKYYYYGGVSVSKFTDAVFVCNFIDDEIAMMGYSIYVDREGFDYLVAAVSQKYELEPKLFEKDNTNNIVWYPSNDIIIYLNFEEDKPSRLGYLDLKRASK